MTAKYITAFLLSSLMVFAGCKKASKEVHPKKLNLSEAVYASGTLQPETEYKVVSSVDGYLQQSLVHEGDAIAKGQVLFKLFNNNKETQTSAAFQLVRRTIPLAGSTAPAVKELENQLGALAAKKQTDSLQYLRYKYLFEQEAIAKSTYEKYWLQYQTSEKDYERVRQQIRQTSLSSDLQLQQAENNAALTRTDKDNTVIKSFGEGKVYEVLKQPGDLVYPNQPLALVGSGQMICKLLVDEDDLEKLHEGQKLLVTMDAYPGKIFKGHIRKIYPLLSRAEQSFRVDAMLDETLPVTMYGLNLEANIIISENRPALVIPKEAVLKGDTVIVKEKGTTRKLHIKKGTVDKEWVEVLDGLTESSTLIIEQ